MWRKRLQWLSADSAAADLGADRCLTLERLRWRQPTIKVESPEHTLLECIDNAEINLLCEQFISDVREINGDLLNLQQPNALKN
jgi:hypothetical protein